MNNQKTNKRTLTVNLLSLLVCISMLVVATFAWFTDSASTKANKITSGSLDVDIVNQKSESLDGKALNWVDQNGSALENTLWEPGTTFLLESFRVINNGSLALKYQISIEGIDGSQKLAEVIDFTVSYQNAEGKTETVNLESFTGHLTKGSQSELFTISAKMRETAGNDYQNLTIDGLYISVVATQDTVESDSTGKDYDKDASYATSVSNEAELDAALKSGKNIVLKNDIQLTKAIEIPSSVTITGNGKTKLIAAEGTTRVINVQDSANPITLTLTDMTIDGPTSGTDNRGITVYNTTDFTIVLDNCSVSTNYYALNIASNNDKVNIVVKNTTLEGYAGFRTWSTISNATFENCTIIGNNIFDYAPESNDYGTIALNPNSHNSSLTFNNCTIQSKSVYGNNQALFIFKSNGSTINVNNCTLIDTIGSTVTVSEFAANPYKYVEVDTNYATEGSNTIIIDGTSITV